MQDQVRGLSVPRGLDQGALGAASGAGIEVEAHGVPYDMTGTKTSKALPVPAGLVVSRDLHNSAGWLEWSVYFC